MRGYALAMNLQGSADCDMLWTASYIECFELLEKS